MRILEDHQHRISPCQRFHPGNERFQRSLPPDELRKAKAGRVERKPLDRDEWRAVVALLVLFLPNTLFWATYEQQGNTIALWADANTDRTVNFLAWTAEIPTTWFQAFNPRQAMGPL